MNWDLILIESLLDFENKRNFYIQKIRDDWTLICFEIKLYFFNYFRRWKIVRFTFEGK